MAGLAMKARVRPGSGGIQDPLKKERSLARRALKVLPDPSQLPIIQDTIKQAR